MGVDGLQLTKGQLYYKRHRDTELERSRLIREDPKRVQYMADYQVKNREHLNRIKKEWQDNHPEYKEWKRKWERIQYKTNKKFRDRHIKKVSKWAKENPEKKLKNHIKHIMKVGKIYDMSFLDTAWALKSWGMMIKQSFVSCVICGEEATRAHHIFEKQYYPELAFNFNNGISLCTQHHKEVHGQKVMGGLD